MFLFRPKVNEQSLGSHRRQVQTRATAHPRGPGDIPPAATTFPSSKFGGRESQSIVFLRGALKEKLYSGQAIKIPSQFLKISLASLTFTTNQLSAVDGASTNVRTLSGNVRDAGYCPPSRSWLKKGKSKSAMSTEKVLLFCLVLNNSVQTCNHFGSSLLRSSDHDLQDFLIERFLQRRKCAHGRVKTLTRNKGQTVQYEHKTNLTAKDVWAYSRQILIAHLPFAGFLQSQPASG